MIASFKILGNPRVKKNGQKVAFRYGRPIKYNTKAYQEWHDSALSQIQSDKTNKRITGIIDYPVNLQCEFFMATRQRVDLSALYEGIQDVLVEVGILADDNYKIVASHDGSGVFWDKENPRMEITISRKDTTNGYRRTADWV